MLYDVKLSITYRYPSLAKGGRHVLRLVPANIDGIQRVIAHSMTLDPKPDEEQHRIDFFGNACVEIVYDGSVSKTRFAAQARVECFPRFDTAPMSSDLAMLKKDLLSLTDIGGHSPHHFVHDSPRIWADPALRRWALQFALPGISTATIAENLCAALHQEMTFDLKATAVDMPFDKAFENRRGVCQDYSHIAIAALRSIGIPAGYVSGFLRTIPPEGKPRMEGVDAMHAWVRVWCGSNAGWIEFDPTNAIRAGTDHIVIGYGRDYFDVAPVKGALWSSGSQETKQIVDVMAIQQ